jgi:hypothetical protein
MGMVRARRCLYPPLCEVRKGDPMSDDQTQHPVDAGLVELIYLADTALGRDLNMDPDAEITRLADALIEIRQRLHAIVATGGAVLDKETVQDILWLFSPEGESPFDSRQYQERKARILAALPKEGE